MIFVCTWTPYAFVAIASAITDYEISPLVGTLPAVIAKSSMLWSSLFFLFTNKIIRRNISNSTNHSLRQFPIKRGIIIIIISLDSFNFDLISFFNPIR